MSALLDLKNVSIQFGGLKAVNDLSFTVHEGSITALIGPNGAGKTTVFNLMTGVYQPTAGAMEFVGKSIVGLKPHQIAQRGICRTFQNIRLFQHLTVLENVLIGYDINAKAGILASVWQSPKMVTHEKQANAKGLELLNIFNLQDRAHDRAMDLPYGQQRRLEIARALATGVKLLLLDEPAAGLNSQETTALMQTIRNVRDRFKLTVLLIEHDMKLVMGISEKIIVLESGCKIADGSPEAVRQNPRVIAAYLGKAPNPKDGTHA